jgi:hypothetical protein
LLLAYALTGTISIAASQVAMGLGAGVALADRGRTLAFHRVRTGLGAPILAFVAASLLATAFASDPAASAEKLKKLLLFAMVLWPPVVLLRSWNLGRVYVMLLFAAGVTSLYGVTTFLWQGGPEIGARIRGLHGFYLTNSGLLLLCTFPALAFARCPSVAPSFRVGSSIAAAAILTSQILGCLPGTWLGTAAGLVTLAIRTRSRALAALLAGLALFAAFGPTVFRERFDQFVDPSGDLRTELRAMARNTTRLVALDPWTGWGLQDLGAEVGLVREPGESSASPMSSVPAQVLVSMGIPGLAAFCWLAASFFGLVSRARRGAASPFTRAVVDSTEASLVGFFAEGLLVWNFGDSEILALASFLLGTTWAAGRIVPEPPRKSGA